MRIYQKNIARLKQFYQSDYFIWLSNNEPDYIPQIENILYNDPDGCDIELYHALSKKYNLEQKKNNLFDEVNGHQIKLSADIVCGAKQLKEAHPNFNDWIKDYEQVRSSLELHFLWPQHRLPTINTYRYTIYQDRIDYLLYDLKCYFEGQITPMIKAYQNRDTLYWLNKFNNNFSQFVFAMHFETFVDKNMRVLDIESGLTKIVSGNLKELQRRSRNKNYLKNYLEQLLKLNEKGAFCFNLKNCK